MTIDRIFLELAVDFIRKKGGKTGPKINSLLSDTLAMTYYDESNKRVAGRCREVLKWFMVNGVENRKQVNEFVQILEFVAQLKDYPAAGIEYKGKNEAIEEYLTTGKGGFMSKQSTWFGDSIDSVKKYIADNIQVLRVFREEAHKTGDSVTEDNIERTIEAYQRISDGVEGLRDTVADRQTEVARKLQEINKLVLGNRSFIKGGEYVANLDTNNPESCFVMMQEAIDEAKEVYQQPVGRRLGKPLDYSPDEVEYRKDDTFSNLVTIAAKRKTFDELRRSIERKLFRPVEPDQRARAELEEKMRIAIANSDKYDMKFQNGEISEEEASVMIDAFESQIASYEAQLARLSESEAGHILSSVDDEIIWDAISNSIIDFVNNCSVYEFMCFADEIIDALRNVYNYLNGNVAAGQNMVSLDSAASCVKMLTALRIQEDAQRKEIRRILLEEQREAMDAQRRVREAFVTSGGTDKKQTNGFGRRQERLARQQQRTSEERAVDPLTSSASGDPIVHNSGSINDDD